MGYTISQLADQIGAKLVGKAQDAGRNVRAVGPIDAAGADEITFAGDERHRASLTSSAAGAAIVSSPVEDFDRPQLVVDNVDAALIEVLGLLAPKLKAAPEGIDETAKIGDGVKIGQGASIGACVVVGDRVEIGPNSVIGSGCKIGENSKIGSDCRLDSNVVVYHNCQIGKGVVIQANSTIGATGFGYRFVAGAHKLVPHNGSVVIEDFVEIGANCCVDRAKFGSTIIGAGTKIDNLVQIAHNVIIGKCCLIAALVGISGSCRLGDGVVLGGQVGLADNISVGSGVMVGAQSGVMGDVPDGKQLAWTPAVDRKDALRIVGSVMRLPKMVQQLKELNKRIDSLEASKDHQE
jgi:UDP-3-O-[3-hydroxymyristoyl] glucosamine N-acyltransferase